VALISRGSCTFRIKHDFAKAAGAIGVVVYNNIEGPLSGTLGEGTDNLPSIGILKADGLALVQKLGTSTYNIFSRNITT